MSKATTTKTTDQNKQLDEITIAIGLLANLVQHILAGGSITSHVSQIALHGARKRIQRYVRESGSTPTAN